ncbi:MAG: hypothetical protein CV045_07360 [Cyanobacteria bacterium M5B4]|nr:MAG: hypothetical protein CV045_07360 [Cyanobacteria bacterium M5B4]
MSTESDFSSLIFDQTISNNYLRLNNLTGATLYYIRIKGINTYSQSKEFAYSSTSTLFSASNIQAPILISVENVSFSGFSCFWQTRPYATNYILKVNSDKYFLPNIDSFSLLGLLPDTQYTISLYGVDLGNSRVSLESNQIVVRTLASPTAITLNPAIVEEWNNIRISWTGDTQYTSYQVSLFDESFSVVGFYDNLSVGTNTFYTFRYGLISGRKYTYQVKGLIESQVASIASSSFTTPFLAPTVSVLADGLTVLWEGKVNKVEGMISKDGILSPLFPISTSLPFIQLPPDISFVRAYFEEGDSYSYKSNIVSIQEMPWIRIEKLTNSSVEIKFNNLSDFYFVQAFKEGTVLQGYESPLKISTNTFSLKNLTFNTEYLIKVFYDNKEFPLLVFRTLPYSSLNQGSTTFTPSDCKIIEKGSYYIALRFNTANKVLYRIRISQNEQLKYFEEYFTEKEVFFITNLIPNSTYFLEVRKIVVDEDGVGQLSLPVELTSNTLDEIEKENITNLTLNLFAPLEREGGQYEFSFAFSAPIQNITPIISTNNTFTEIIEVDYLEIPKANKFILFNLGAGTYYIKVQVNNGFFYSKESNVITFTV